MQVGKNIRTARKQANLTQDELAHLMGLTRTSITNIEKGIQRSTLHVYYAIAECLDVPVYMIFGQESVKQGEIVNLQAENAKLKQQLADIRSILDV
jgi:transcriptional regulator with XRE-family HTH domain